MELNLLANKEEQKEKAIKLMKELDIYKPYIDGFKTKNEVCFYENFGGFWAWQETELINKVKEFEEEHNCTVYAITHEFTEFGELYDFLYVDSYKDEWDSLLEKAGPTKFYAMAYVWNKDDDYCSEYGSILLQSFGGGIRRIG